MNNKSPKYLLETDILVDYLTTKNKEDTFLLKLMLNGICFTSVINASEMMYFIKSKYELKVVKDLLYALKVLGIHSRYSLSIPKYSSKFKNSRDTLFYILADINKLIIVTLKPEKYSNINVKVIHPSKII